ncbi:unnamed protein product [Leptosia nina]|uniref:Radial spoke head protein 3 homolog n=1 Tax=Leptosia nina TaxID=320188 RepID=A0AAV1JSN1_9NEOP
MPLVNIEGNVSNAFTVINQAGADMSVPIRNVNVVKPLERHVPPAPDNAQSILDPKFSRALDYKLRRLKEKETLAANLRRPTRCRPHPHTSQPDIRVTDGMRPQDVSRSHPRIDTLGAERHRILPKIETPSPTKVRGKVNGGSESDKPRFVTTVKSGEFLLPPPDLARLLGLNTLYPLYTPRSRENLVYSYSSRPKPVANRTKRSLVEKKEKSDRPDAAQVPNEAKRMRGVFNGVRNLAAGVSGLQQLLKENENRLHPDGSVTTAATGATGAQYSNVMHDKRVVRGSTFAAHPHAAGDGAESAAARAARTRRRALARRAALARLRPGTPPPAPGRRHHPIQTEYYLEELFDKGVEMEVGVQTDLFVDRPATPIYVPAKTGADAATQIYPGDLFDFDLEVQPILEVLVGKTVEQALAEVAQEEELSTLREQQRRYRELRAAELAERQRLAAQDRRLHHEAQRRVAEARRAKVSATEARHRVAASALVQGYVAELLPSVLAGLRDAGYLVRRLHRGVEEEFMPWLVEEVSKEIESIITSRDVISEIVREVAEARAELYAAAGEREYENETPPDSITPPELAPEEEEEYPRPISQCDESPWCGVTAGP